MSESAQEKVRVQFHDIDQESDGQRLDNYLFRELKGVPKSRVYRALRHGEVRVNKKRVKAAYRLKAGDVLRIPPLRVAEKKEVFVGDQLLQSLEKAILFEDDSLLVINKPSGLAVHGGSGLDYGLIEALRKMRPQCKRLELAHRLDRDTSGCTIVVKKASVLKAIHAQLREKTMDKRYLALVHGRWPKRKELVNQPLMKNVLASGERMVRVNVEGKPSKTAFAIKELYEKATLVEASPITGRTHQIRVHAQHTGYPIFCDNKYGLKEAKDFEQSIGLKRLFLHAAEVTFRVPGEDKPRTVRAPLPNELKEVLKQLTRINKA